MVIVQFQSKFELKISGFYLYLYIICIIKTIGEQIPMRQRSINSFNNVSVMSAPKTNAYFMTPWELDELRFITHKRTLSSRFPPNHFIMSIRITIKVLMKPNQTSGSGGDNPIRFVRVDNQQVPMNITAQFKSVSERYIIGCPPTG